VKGITGWRHGAFVRAVTRPDLLIPIIKQLCTRVFILYTWAGVLFDADRLLTVVIEF